MLCTEISIPYVSRPIGAMHVEIGSPQPVSVCEWDVHIFYRNPKVDGSLQKVGINFWVCLLVSPPEHG